MLPQHVRKTDSVVHNLDLQDVAWLNLDSDPACLGSGMAHNVGECLLHNPKGCHLDRGRQRRDLLAPDEDLESDSARDTQTYNAGLDCTIEAKLVEHWWTQIVHDGAQIGDNLFEVHFKLCEQSIRASQVTRQQPARGAGPKHLPGKGWANAVVEVTAQTAAFFLHHVHQPSLGAPEV